MPASLPEESLITIFGFLQDQDLSLVVPCVCKDWHRIANDPLIWKKRCTAARIQDVHHIQTPKFHPLFLLNHNEPSASSSLSPSPLPSEDATSTTLTEAIEDGLGIHHKQGAWKVCYLLYQSCRHHWVDASLRSWMGEEHSHTVSSVQFKAVALNAVLSASHDGTVKEWYFHKDSLQLTCTQTYSYIFDKSGIDCFKQVNEWILVGTKLGNLMVWKGGQTAKPIHQARAHTFGGVKALEAFVFETETPFFPANAYSVYSMHSSLPFGLVMTGSRDGKVHVFTMSESGYLLSHLLLSLDDTPILHLAFTKLKMTQPYISPLHSSLSIPCNCCLVALSCSMNGYIKTWCPFTGSIFSVTQLPLLDPNLFVIHINHHTESHYFGHLICGGDDNTVSSIVPSYPMKHSTDPNNVVPSLHYFKEYRVLWRGHHEDWITSVKVDWFCNLVFSGSWDRTIRIWDLMDGQCLRILSRSTVGTFHTNGVLSLGIQRKGNKYRMASGSISFSNTDKVIQYIIK